MKPVRILMLEDNPIDINVIRKILSGSLQNTALTITDNAADYISRLNEQIFDVILCDYQLPDFNGVRALQIRNQKDSSVPFILITGAVSEEVALAMIQEGADDYILKDRLQRLPVAIEKALARQRINSDKRSAEASLEQLTERFQMAAKTSYDVIWDYDLEKQSVYCSDAIKRIIGTSLKENFHPEYLKTFIHSRDRPLVEKSFCKILSSSENRWRKIFRLMREDGAEAWVNVNALIIRNKSEVATRVVGVLHDITEMRRLQHELIEKEVENQKQITQVTIQAQEKERMEIGKELHDNVNQLLATAKIMIDTAKNSPELHDLCLSKSQESIMNAINELRNIAHSMMPPHFEEGDFKDAVADLALNINLTGKVNLELFLPPADKLDLLSSEIKLAFYRIIQEQMSNILKHSKAKNVSIVIDVNNAGCSLVIEDDGIGFDVQKNAKGIGLKNIESRCRLFGGTLHIVTEPGEGCFINVQIPVKGQVYA